MKTAIINAIMNYIFYYLDKIIPDCINNKKLYTYNCKKKNFERALLRINYNSDVASWVNAYYQSIQYSIHRVDRFFSKYNDVIVRNINAIDNIVILELLIYLNKNNVDLKEYYYQLPLHTSNTKRILIRYGTAIIEKEFFCSKYDSISREVTDLRLFQQAMIRLGVTIDEIKNYKGVEKIECGLTNFVLTSRYSYTDLLTLIENTKEKYKIKVLFLIGAFSPNENLSLYIRFNYEKLIIRKKDQVLILRLLYKHQLFEEYISLYESNRVNSVNEKIIYLFLKNEYSKILKIYNFLFKTRQVQTIAKMKGYFYLSYMSVGYLKSKEFVPQLKKIGVDVGSYTLLDCLYNGDIVQAEVAREKMPASFQSYINLNFQSINKENYYSQSKKLFMAESGVADEVRWARLFKFIDAPNVSITCDPRFYLLFKNAFPNLTFIPFGRLHRGQGTSVLEYHKSNTPEMVEDFDFISSTSKLFSLIDEKNIHPTFDGHIQPFNFFNAGKNERIKIGLLWASGLSSGLRGLRYAISPDFYVPLIESYKDVVDFHCIQSPLSDEDKLFCTRHGIYINEDVDLYNDFYNSARYYSSMDFVIGVSSLNTELAASTGTIFLHIANAPEVSLMRGVELEQLGSNTLTVTPQNPYILKNKSTNNVECIEKVIKMIGYRIDFGIERFKDKYCN